MHGYENKGLFDKETEMSVKRGESWKKESLTKTN